MTASLLPQLRSALGQVEHTAYQPRLQRTGYHRQVTAPSLAGQRKVAPITTTTITPGTEQPVLLALLRASWCSARHQIHHLCMLQIVTADLMCHRTLGLAPMCTQCPPKAGDCSSRPLRCLQGRTATPGVGCSTPRAVLATHVCTHLSHCRTSSAARTRVEGAKRARRSRQDRGLGGLSPVHICPENHASTV